MSTIKLTPETIALFTPPAKAPELARLAEACHNGACNAFALVRAFGQAIGELPTHEAREHPAVKLCLGQLSYLCGESLGPTFEALHNYETWAAQGVGTPTTQAASDEEGVSR
jgi:hypothetical protein